MRMPSVWNNTNTAPAKKLTAKLELSAETFANKSCPVSGEPMQIVRINYQNMDGSMSKSFVMVHPDTRVVLPLPNEELEALEASQK